MGDSSRYGKRQFCRKERHGRETALLAEQSTGITWSWIYSQHGNFQSLRLDVSVNDFTREGESVAQASGASVSFC